MSLEERIQQLEALDRANEKLLESYNKLCLEQRQEIMCLIRILRALGYDVGTRFWEEEEE